MWTALSEMLKIPALEYCTMITKLDYFDYEISIILTYALFYGGCLGSPMWMGSGDG